MPLVMLDYTVICPIILVQYLSVSLTPIVYHELFQKHTYQNVHNSVPHPKQSGKVWFIVGHISVTPQYPVKSPPHFCARSLIDLIKYIFLIGKETLLKS